MKLVGLDTGLATFGVAVADITDAGLRFERVEVWQTRPSSRKRGVRKADVTAERARTLASNLHALLGEVKPIALCVEAVALPFGRCRSSVVSMLGRARGLVDALAEIHGLAELELLPQELKLACTGTGNATKDEIRIALEALYPELGTLWPVPSLVEHAADAAGAIHAVRNCDVVLAALKARAAA